MKRLIGVAALGGALFAGVAAQAEDRDYGRGFFLGVEALFAEARNTNSDFAVDNADSGTTVEADFGRDASPRVWFGYSFGDRIGTFSLSYWNYSDDASEEEDNGGANGLRSTIRNDLGDFDFAQGTADIDATVWDVMWSHRLASRGKFNAYWGAGLRYFSFDETLESEFGAGPGGPFQTIEAESDSSGFGVRVGMGGEYNFTPHFGMQAGAAVAFLTGSTDTHVEAPSLAFERNDDSDKTFTQLEAKLGFVIHAVKGLDVGFGYKYAEWQDVISIPTRGGSDDNVTFEGPYVNVGYRFGVPKVDSDGDTVLDGDDDCPDTPRGCTVDEKGCPKDSDKDGVCDGLDKCPDTPFGAKVDPNGCSLDTDGDTVADGLDICPGTPFGCRVDRKGCPIDTDGDGVCDGIDQCPDTPRGTKVDTRGCPTSPGDSDGDTVPDDRDRCPNTPRGVSVDEYGCERVLILENVLFDFDKDVIKPEFFELLNKIAGEMSQDSQLRLELRGHTDSVNTEEYNMGLGARRAASVRTYLVGKDVSGERLTTRSFGESQPVAPNTTDAGRAKNRRVEFQRTR